MLFVIEIGRYGASLLALSCSITFLYSEFVSPAHAGEDIPSSPDGFLPWQGLLFGGCEPSQCSDGDKGHFHREHLPASLLPEHLHLQRLKNMRCLQLRAMLGQLLEPQQLPGNDGEHGDGLRKTPKAVKL